MEDSKKSINADIARREKRVMSECKIESAKDLSRARLSVLQTQSDTMAQILEEATKAVSSASEGGNYGALLEMLIEQGLAKVLEPHAVVSCRQADKAAVEAAIPAAVEKFLAKHGKEGATCNVVVSEDFLKDTMLDGSAMAGGVVIRSKSGHITVDNTLNARLAIAQEVMLPRLKSELFGSCTVMAKQIQL